MSPLLPQLYTFLTTLVEAEPHGAYTAHAKTLQERLKEYVEMPMWKRSTLYHLVNCYDYGRAKLSYPYAGWHAAIDPQEVKDFFAQLQQQELLDGELGDVRFDNVILTGNGYAKYRSLGRLIW